MATPFKKNSEYAKQGKGGLIIPLLTKVNVMLLLKYDCIYGILPPDF